MFILKKGHHPGVYVPLRALFLVFNNCDNALRAILKKVIRTLNHLLES